MAQRIVLLFLVLQQSTVGVRISFADCQQPECFCVAAGNNVPRDIIYSCSSVKSDVIIHLEDCHRDRIRSVIIQNCKDVRVVLDCPVLQETSHLQRLTIKDCDRLEFVTLISSSLQQTPPELIIQNVREIISFPRKLFKNPSTNTELKCAGSASMRKIKVINSKINSINSKAVYNVSGIKNIEFENVTITNIENQAIEAIMGFDNTLFTILNSRIDNVKFSGIAVQSGTASISQTIFRDVTGSAINVTSEYLYITGNTFNDISATGLILKSVSTNINDNDINALRRGALASVRCARKWHGRKKFTFSRNRIKTIEPNSLNFDYHSCKSSNTDVFFTNNKMDCKCRNLAFLYSGTANNDLYGQILDTANNNTCISAPCSLPVEVIKYMLDNSMCQLNLDPQVMCLMYNDRHMKNEVTTDEDITEPAPTFYLIRQANSPAGDASAAMTAIDKDDLLKDSRLNMTNRTIVKVFFNSSGDFVETLRSTSSTRKRPEEHKAPATHEYVNRCVGSHCRSNAYDKQKALDFYKYVYAQLRSPRQNEGGNTEKT